VDAVVAEGATGACVSKRAIPRSPTLSTGIISSRCPTDVLDNCLNLSSMFHAIRISCMHKSRIALDRERTEATVLSLSLYC
jgi:hypothetical protein